MWIDFLYEVFQHSTGVSIDSRNVQQGELFFALRGPNFDGHDFVEQALDSGAKACVVDQRELEDRPHVIWYPNTYVALQRLARKHRDQYDIPFIAITGSNGKTTTKELTGAVLSSHYHVVSTKGNLNNHLGVPLTLLKVDKRAELAIIEMGANHIGEINWLCQIANPSHGLVTNVGKAHIDGFGSEAGVRRGKYELYHFLQAHQGVSFHNAMEPSLSDLPQLLPNIVSFDQDHLPGDLKDVNFDSAEGFNRMSLDHGPFRSTQLIGEFNQHNILTACALGSYFAVPKHKIELAITSYIPQNNRSQIVYRGSNTYLLDAYNANPSSMLQVIQALEKQNDRSKIIVLGDMYELGDTTREEHISVLRKAAQLPGLQEILLVGQKFKLAMDSLQSFDTPISWFEDVVALKRYLVEKNPQDSYFLIKGSRAMQLEQILD